MTCNCNNSNSSEAAPAGCGTPCPTCSTQPMVTPSPCACNTSCGCQSGIPATPVPFYAQAPGCEESHLQTIVQNQYVTGLMTTNNVNMPSVHVLPLSPEYANLIIPGLVKINVGSYLWHPVYGYLRVVSFDYASSTVVVENEGQPGNAASGTEIRACTLFTVVDNPTSPGPCGSTLATSGTLLVCDNGVAAPLDAAFNGQVPIVIDAANNIVEFQTLDVPVKTCTTLLTDVTLIPASTGPYNFNLDSDVGFDLGVLFQVGNRTDRFLVVNKANDGHNVSADVNPASVGFDTILAGNQVCVSSCCEQVQLDVDNILVSLGDPCGWSLVNRFYHEALELNSGLVGATIIPGGTFHTNEILVTFQNPFCKSLSMLIELYFELNGVLTPDTDGTLNGLMYFQHALFPHFGYTLGALNSGPVAADLTLANLANHYTAQFSSFHTVLPFTLTDSRSQVITIPANQEAAVRVYYDWIFSNFHPYGVSNLVVSAGFCSLKAIKVAF